MSPSSPLGFALPLPDCALQLNRRRLSITRRAVMPAWQRAALQPVQKLLPSCLSVDGPSALMQRRPRCCACFRPAGDKLFFDKRDGSNLDLLTVAETAPEAVPEDKDNINGVQHLSIEATATNQAFSQQAGAALNLLQWDSPARCRHAGLQLYGVCPCVRKHHGHGLQRLGLLLARSSWEGLCCLFACCVAAHASRCCS